MVADWRCGVYAADIHMVHVKDGTDSELPVVGIMYETSEYGDNLEVGTNAAVVRTAECGIYPLAPFYCILPALSPLVARQERLRREERASRGDLVTLRPHSSIRAAAVPEHAAPRPPPLFAPRIEQIANLWNVLDMSEATTDEVFATAVYDLVPAGMSFSHYIRSLTTPPCTCTPVSYAVPFGTTLQHNIGAMYMNVF